MTQRVRVIRLKSVRRAMNVPHVVAASGDVELMMTWEKFHAIKRIRIRQTRVDITSEDKRKRHAFYYKNQQSQSCARFP